MAAVSSTTYTQLTPYQLAEENPGVGTSGISPQPIHPATKKLSDHYLTELKQEILERRAIRGNKTDAQIEREFLEPKQLSDQIDQISRLYKQFVLHLELEESPESFVFEEEQSKVELEALLGGCCDIVKRCVDEGMPEDTFKTFYEEMNNFNELLQYFHIIGEEKKSGVQERPVTPPLALQSAPEESSSASDVPQHPPLSVRAFASDPAASAKAQSLPSELPKESDAVVPYRAQPSVLEHVSEERDSVLTPLNLQLQVALRAAALTGKEQERIMDIVHADWGKNQDTKRDADRRILDVILGKYRDGTLGEDLGGISPVLDIVDRNHQRGLDALDVVVKLSLAQIKARVGDTLTLLNGFVDVEKKQMEAQLEKYQRETDILLNKEKRTLEMRLANRRAESDIDYQALAQSTELELTKLARQQELRIRDKEHSLGIEKQQMELQVQKKQAEYRLDIEKTRREYEFKEKEAQTQIRQKEKDLELKIQELDKHLDIKKKESDIEKANKEHEVELERIRKDLEIEKEKAKSKIRIKEEQSKMQAAQSEAEIKRKAAEQQAQIQLQAEKANLLREQFQSATRAYERLVDGYREAQRRLLDGRFSKSKIKILEDRKPCIQGGVVIPGAFDYKFKYHGR